MTCDPASSERRVHASRISFAAVVIPRWENPLLVGESEPTNQPTHAQQREPGPHYIARQCLS